MEFKLKFQRMLESLHIYSITLQKKNANSTVSTFLALSVQILHNIIKCKSFKVHMTRNFLLAYSKELSK